MRPLWTEPSSPRLWRATPSDFLHDEVGSAAEVYTDGVLARLAGEPKRVGRGELAAASNCSTW